MSEKTKPKETEEESRQPAKKQEKGKTCFVIAPIDKVGSEIRKRSDQVFKHVISAVVESMGYRPIRADHISEPGIITSQVIQHVVESTIVVADLTGRNPNVFYELAIRHAIRKPLVQLISAGESIPFDVAGTRTISIDISDLDSVEQAKKELTKQIESIEKGKIAVDSPISVALDLKILRESDNPEQRSLADVVSAISNLRNAIVEIEKRIRNPEVLIPPDYMAYCMRRYREEALMRRDREEALIHRRETSSLRARLLDELRVVMERLNDEKTSVKEKQALLERQQFLLHRIDVIEHE